MALIRLPPTIRTTSHHLNRISKQPLITQVSTHPRLFTTTPLRPLNPLLNLSHFSAAKEAQHLSREKRIPREEFHPYLQLIRSSSVDPFAPAPGSSPSVVAALNRARSGQSDTETALRLAVSNLMGRLEATKSENEEILRVLGTVQERWRREERNALLMVAVVAALGCLVVVKTRVVEDLMAWVGSWGEADDAFRWGLLGSSSEHLQHLAPRRMRITETGYVTEALPQAREGEGRGVATNSSPEVVKVQQRIEESPRAIVSVVSTHSQSESRSLLSRLFWAAPKID